MEERKATLVLDMNGTLVSTSDVKRSVLDKLAKASSSSSLYEDGTLAVRYSDNHTQLLSIMKRPGLDEFLEEMARFYDIIIFSHSEGAHVRAVHEFIDPGRQFVPHSFSREFCDGETKDLRKLGVDLKRVVWLDDSPGAFLGFPECGIVVPRFDVEKCHSRGLDPRKDGLLSELGPFLKAISSMKDMRPGIKLWNTKNWKLVDGQVVEKSRWHVAGLSCTIL